MLVVGVKEEEGVTKESGVPPTETVRRRKVNANVPYPRVAAAASVAVLLMRLPSGHRCMSLSVLLKRLMSQDYPILLEASTDSRRKLLRAAQSRLKLNYQVS